MQHAIDDKRGVVVRHRHEIVDEGDSMLEQLHGRGGRERRGGDFLHKCSKDAEEGEKEGELRVREDLGQEDIQREPFPSRCQRSWRHFVEKYLGTKIHRRIVPVYQYFRGW